MNPDGGREPALTKAFNHIATLGAQADLSQARTPLDQFVVVLRHVMRRYGDVGPQPSLQGVRILPVSADGVSAEWVVAPGASPHRRLLYVHGGGWSAGAPEDYRGISSTLARLSAASVLVIDYRLAPEHPFPAGLEDCVRALAWIATHGPEGRVAEALQSTQVAVVGDSAGAGMAAGAVLETIVRGQRVPDRLALIAGALDNHPHPERVGIRDGIVSPESLAAGLACLVGSDQNAARDPRVSPALAPAEILARFPPTLLQASNIETLLYDSRKFAGRLQQAGVRTVLSIWPELPHVWHAFLGLFPEATAALHEIADFLYPRPHST